MEALLGAPAAIVVAAVFGALWGSFFNVVIARVPLGQSVVRPGSHCFSCGKPVRPWDNVPILSYFVLRGRCRSCGARFSPRYLLIEVLAAAISALVYWQFAALAADLPAAVRLGRFAVYFAFAGVLLVLAVIDLDTKRLPDIITLPSIPVFFIAGFAAHDVGWLERAIGAAGGYLAVRLIADAYYYLMRREGLGLGDGKLLAVIGAVMGWRALPFVIFMASFIGIVVSVPLLIWARRKRADSAARSEPEGPGVRHTEVPFGPFLSLSALIYLFLGTSIVELTAEAVLGLASSGGGGG
jgi:leader peptidase (prepilin peptidase)/N-methyltransferase